MTFTGKFIFEIITKLQNELSELGEACDLVSDEIGQQSTAYKLLNTQYHQKQKELDKALNSQYKES